MKFEKISQEDREKLERRLYKTIVEEFRREKIKDGYYKYIVSLQEFKFITDITDNKRNFRDGKNYGGRRVCS